MVYTPEPWRLNSPHGRSFWEANGQALASRQPELVRLLVNLPDAVHLTIVEAKNGQPVLTSKGVSLHSRQDPEAEGRAWAESPQVKEAVYGDRPIVVFGLGLGYHLRPLLTQPQKLIVLEPDRAVIRSALELFDWQDTLPRMTLVTSVGDLPSHLAGRAMVLPHRPTARLHPVELARLESLAAGRGEGPQARPAGTSWKIMVVTPVRGGSLPIARHVVRNLTLMGHHVVDADYSGLDPYFRALDSNRVSGKQRDQTWGHLTSFVRDYAVMLAEAEKPDLLLAMAQAPLDVHTLARLRAMGLGTAFWFVEDYRYLPYFRHLAASYDYFFHIQGPAMAAELSRLGVRHQACLPMAADPEVFRPINDIQVLEPYRATLSFMGAGYPNRRNVFESLLDYDFKIWGTEWDLETPVGRRVQENGRRVTTAETVLIYNAATINLNLHSSIFAHDLDPDGGFINPRTFEIAACGAFQLVDRRAPLTDFFEPGKEVAVFDSVNQLRSQIDFYLAHPDQAKEMAKQARIRVLAEHTYHHRLKTLLQFIAGS